MKLRSKQNKRKVKSNANLETALISRLRTNTVEYATVIRGSFTDSNTGGVTGQSYCVFLNYPSYYRPAAGGIAQCTTTSAILATEQKVFDEYKVTKLVVKYMPWVTGQIRVNTAVAFTGPVDPTLVMTVDYDDFAQFSSLAQAYTAQNAAIHSTYEPGFKVCVMKQQDKLDAMKWMNFQAIVPSASTPPDPNNPVKTSSIKLWKQAYQLMSTTEGTIFCEWTILLKGIYSLA